MQIKPLHDRVLIRRLPEEAKSTGGIFIPDTAKEKPLQGTIVAVGSGRHLDDGTIQPVGLKNGDTVLFGKYAGIDVEVDGEQLLIAREEDVLGVANAG